MHRSTRRLLLFLVSLAPALVVLALLYQAGMQHLEGEGRTFWRSLMTVAETVTTTGYGADSRWSSPLMNVYLILLQLVGVLIFFLVFPVYLLPYMEERFEQRLPSHVRSSLRGHILIYRYGPAVATLLKELEDAEIPCVVLEEEEPDARRLLDRGIPVVCRRLDDEALTSAGLTRARALIANGNDEQNAAVVLAARQLGFEGETLAVVEEAHHRQAMLMAGATAVFDPRHLLGATLAAKASQKISPTVAGVRQIGRRLEIWEVRVQADSELAGGTLGSARIAPRTGATVIGLWVGGSLNASPSASTFIEPHSVLVVAGSRESMARLQDLAGPARPLLREGHFVVAGYGEVGRKVVELLRDAGEEVRVLDRQDLDGVDVVADVLRVGALEELGVEGAQAVILALDADSVTLFATVIVRGMAPDVMIVARVNRDANLKRIHQAGADFALSVSGVAGQMLARRLLHQESVAVDKLLKVQKFPVGSLVGERPAELEIRHRTGSSVVAVERGEEVIVEFGPDFRFEPEDSVYVCGSREAVRRFAERFP